jgi:xanthine dehydrogenase YagS FAD-binding subunit
MRASRATLHPQAGTLRAGVHCNSMSPIEVTMHPPFLSGAEAAARAAGATNIVESMRLEAVEPRVHTDFNPLHQGRYGQVESNEEGLRFGTLVRMGQAEDHPIVRARYPVIRDALVLTSSKQIRNMATVGGNLLQRNREHAVRGTRRSCIATYSDDFAQSLIALDATVDTIGASAGPRRIRFAELLLRQGETPHLETRLQPGELITFINIPAGPWTRRSRYMKIRDRHALASVAVALHMEGNKVRQARVALGGLETVPWRSHEAEAILKGHTLDESLAARAAEAAFARACAGAHDSFKIPLGKRALVSALLETRAMRI